MIYIIFEIFGSCILLPAINKSAIRKNQLQKNVIIFFYFADYYKKLSKLIVLCKLIAMKLIHLFIDVF